MNQSEWFDKIEKLSNKKGVKKIAVQNFLASVGSNPDKMSAMMNAEMDAGMYGWNSATQGAIYDGISIYFDKVKTGESKASEKEPWADRPYANTDWDVGGTAEDYGIDEDTGDFLYKHNDDEEEFEESYASEDSLVKIEDDDDKDTKVTVLDEWENETDPDVGGDVEGLDQDQVESDEVMDKDMYLYLNNYDTFNTPEDVNDRLIALGLVQDGKITTAGVQAINDHNYKYYDKVQVPNEVSDFSRGSFKNYLDYDSESHKVKSGYIKCPKCNQQFSSAQWALDHMKEAHPNSSVESWNTKSFNQKVEALEAVGFRQGKALRFASLAFEDFSKELQEAIDSVTQEDAEDEQEFIRQTQEDEKEAGLIDEVDYNNIGESRTARSKYECEFCNCGFKSNESLTIHYNDLHAVPPAQIDGYENWKEVADDLYKKELAKLKKRGGEAHGNEEGTSDGAKKGWLTRKRGGKTEEPTTKKQTKTNTKLDKVKGKLLSKLNSGSDYYVKVANLDGYPQNTSQLRGVPVGVKGVIMKSQLTDSYDGANFSVRKDGYNSLNVSWTGGDGGYPYGAQKIADLYSDNGSTNIQFDYFDVDNYVGSVTDDRKDKHPKDPYHVVDSRESRFGNWISHKINEDWSGYREKFGGHIDNSVTKTMADHILNEPDVTGFNNIKYSDFADLKKEFLEEEKRTGGGNNAKDLPKSSSASSYSQQYMGEDPSKPSEIPYDPNTGEELPVSSFNPNDTKYRQPKETDTVSDMAKAYGDMMAKKKNPDQPMWAKGESYATEDDYQYDFEDLTSLAQDKIESSGVTKSEWDSTPEEERKELEEEIRDGEAYNPSDFVCPECGDITKDDKEFEDHLSAHRFDDGGY